MCNWKDKKKIKSICNRLEKGLGATFVEGTSQVLEVTKLQLEEYFREERKVFDIPLLLVGTEFQKKVWSALLTINYGKTASYLKLSNDIENPKAIRAVASANGANALSIIIPCHRIIGQDGSLVGYAGGLHRKKELLVLESEQKENQYLLF